VSDPPKFRCAAAVYSHNACQGEPFYSEHGGERFCILHCPTDDKGEAFDEAVARKLDHDDWNFNSVWFPNPIDWRDRTVQKDVNFSSARFRETVDFSKTKFEGECHFDGARFSARAEFVRSRFSGGVYFNGARFAHDASFADAEFASDAGFYEVTAPDISFRGATFKEASKCTFRDPTIERLEFFDAVLSGRIEFSGKGRDTLLVGKLDLWNATIATPESVTFKTCLLKPDWLVTVDPARFNFLNVEWDITPLRKALEEGQFRELLGIPGHETLSAVYLALAANAEEHHRFDYASRFHYAALDALRLRRSGDWAIWDVLDRYGKRFADWKIWGVLGGYGKRAGRALIKGLRLQRFVDWAISRLRRLRRPAIWDVHWWYWALSGYGERAGRALAVLVGIWVVFAVLYVLPGVGFQRWEVKPASEKEAAAVAADKRGQPLKFARALTYSLEVMSFQKPSPPAVSPAARVLVAVETIFGPLQAALFALAVRRKVSR
jgi:uncharacterized protein YjbI with pentapeptide repeats